MPFIAAAPSREVRPHDPSDETLAQRANTGDRAAADMLLRRHWEAMNATARYVAGHRFDAEELLAGALEKTWEKWSTGTGPDRNPPGYIAQSMRNRLRDEARSPRSRITSLVDEDDIMADDDLRFVETSADTSAVRDALLSLPLDQQELLIEVIVNGRKPRELEGSLHTSSAAISTGVYRAKQRLRTALLLRLLRSACAREHCRETQERTASETIRTQGVGGPATALSWRCPDCGRGLHAFDELSALVA